MTMENQPEPTALPIPKARVRKKIVYATLAFCFSMIAYLVWTGSPDNSLHESALAWAFSLSIFVISGYVFGAVAERYLDSRK